MQVIEVQTSGYSDPKFKYFSREVRIMRLKFDSLEFGVDVLGMLTLSIETLASQKPRVKLSLSKIEERLTDIQNPGYSDLAISLS